MAEELRLQAAVADAAKNVEQGYNALSAGKPNEAERLFKAALKGLVARPQTAELLSSARWGLAESRYLQACAALEANHVQEARKLINAALEADSAHEDAKALEDYVNRNHGY